MVSAWRKAVTWRFAETAMSHIAIQEALNGSPVTWMEQVSDDQYGAAMNQRTA